MVKDESNNDLLWNFVFLIAGALLMFFVCMTYRQMTMSEIVQLGREQVLNHEVACVLDNMKWKCKPRQEIEQEVKFLMQLQGNTPPAKPKGSSL